MSKVFSFREARQNIAKRSSLPKGFRFEKPKSAIKRVKNVEKSVAKIAHAFELKHEDTLFNAAFDTSGTLTLLNALTQGDSDLTRDGNEVKCTSIQFRARWTADIDSLDASEIRHIIFWDSQPNGAAPTVAGLLDISVITAATIAPYNRATQMRFKILHDEVVIMNPQVVALTVSGATTQVERMREYTRGKFKLSRITKYNGNAGTIADIQSNSLYSLVISNLATETPAGLIGYRLYFHDN